VRKLAWKNPDGSKALIAYNSTGSSQNARVNCGNQSYSYNLPAKTSPTFAWAGVQGNPGGGNMGPITGLAGKCADVAGAGIANGTAVQLYDCNGTAAQQWTVGADGTVRALGEFLYVTGNNSANGTRLQIWICTGGANKKWTVPLAA
jgi:glucosylceramidase